MQSYDLSRLSILIVEKSPLLRSVFRQVLMEMGIERVETVDSIEKSFSAFNSIDPDIVLVDWSPDFDGIGLLEQIRRDKESCNPYVPVILMSANTDTSQILLARDSGITEFLAKPVSPKSLYERIVAITRQDRSFIRSNSFFGPDRRRKSSEFAGEDRRGQAHAAE